jgi:hypothetical protein
MTPSPHIVNRRFFLRAAGISLALPLLESLSPRVLGSGLAVGSQPGAPIRAGRPRRMVCIGNQLGFYQPEFHPVKPGRGYELPRLLQPLAPHREALTVFSGLDHSVKGGHYAVHSFLSGVRSVDAKGMPEGNITLDQRAAETIGGVTRFPTLTIGSEDGIGGGCMMSWNRSGTRVPPVATPRELFRKLFIEDSATSSDRAAARLKRHGSILDAVNRDAKSLARHLDQRDQNKLDEYFTSVREVEKQMELSRRWLGVPKPKPPIPEPQNNGFVSDLPVFYDLISLALQTDSTRIATLEIAGGFEASALGLNKDWHTFSHHGQVKETIDGLLKIERYQMEQFARFLGKLRTIEDGDAKLLDHTMVLFGSGMGNASAHTNTNLPVILAGGGYRHGEHRTFPLTGPGRIPLCNLYLGMLRRFGVEVDRFGPSTGAISDLASA